VGTVIHARFPTPATPRPPRARILQLQAAPAGWRVYGLSDDDVRGPEGVCVVWTVAIAAWGLVEHTPASLAPRGEPLAPAIAEALRQVRYPWVPLVVDAIGELVWTEEIVSEGYLIELEQCGPGEPVPGWARRTVAAERRRAKKLAAWLPLRPGTGAS